MDPLVSIFTYTASLGLAALIPGPGMTGLMFKTFSHGITHSLIMLSGLICGDLIFLTLIIFGLNTLNTLIHGQFATLFILASCCYLLYLAYQFWTFQGDLNPTVTRPDKSMHHVSFFKSYQHGLFITLSNPKTIAFYLALLPSVFGTDFFKQSLILYSIYPLTIFILLCIGWLYIIGAHQMKRLITYKSVQLILLKSTAILMIFLAISLSLALLEQSIFQSL